MYQISAAADIGLTLLMILVVLIIITTVQNATDMIKAIMMRLDTIYQSCNISYPIYVLISDMEIEDPDYKDWDMVYEENSYNIYYMLVTNNTIFMKPRLLEDGSHEKYLIR